MNEIKIFINGIGINMEHVFDLSVQYRIVPQLSACSIGLVDPGGCYVTNDRKDGYNLVAETDYLIALKESVQSRSAKIDYSVPVFKDNDIVHVFEKREGTWWWLFHGYVTNVEFSKDLDGRRKILLHCESGLKSLRYNYTLMNSFRGYEDVDQEVMQKYVNEHKGTFASIALMGMPYYEKIKVLFEGASDIDESDIPNQGEGGFNVDDTWIWESMSDTDEYTKYIDGLSNTKIMFDFDLDNYVNDHLDPQDKVVYVVRIGASAEVFEYIEAKMFASYSLNPGVLTPKLTILSTILQPLNLVAYTLPCGDVVVEPLLNGVIGTTINSWVSMNDQVSLRYSFSGSYIGTCALTMDAPNIMNVPPEGMRQKWVEMTPYVASMDKEAVIAYGLRVITMDEMKVNAVIPEMAELYGQYLLTRSWSMSKTASVTSIWRGMGGLNRPMYVQDIDGWFLNTAYVVSFSPTGSCTAAYELGYGMLWDGNYWGIDVKSAKSGLDFLFEAYKMLETETLNSMKSRQLKFESGKISATIPTVEGVSEVESCSPFKKNAELSREDWQDLWSSWGYKQ